MKEYKCVWGRLTDRQAGGHTFMQVDEEMKEYKFVEREDRQTVRQTDKTYLCASRRRTKRGRIF